MVGALKRKAGHRGDTENTEGKWRGGRVRGPLPLLLPLLGVLGVSSVSSVSALLLRSGTLMGEKWKGARTCHGSTTTDDRGGPFRVGAWS